MDCLKSNERNNSMKKKIYAVLGIFTLIVASTKVTYANDKIEIGIVTIRDYNSTGGDSLNDLPSANQLGHEFSAEMVMAKNNIVHTLYFQENKNAWKKSMRTGKQTKANGEKYYSIDDVDFALFCGHGLKKSEYLSHNALHFYTKNSSTNFCGSDKYTPDSNLLTTETEWGGGTAKTKWVALYSCNFLNQEDGCYKLPLNGIHQVLGFSTRMYVVSDCGKLFAQYLTSGKDIRTSFIMSAYTEILPRMNEKCVVTILSAKQSVNDTIYKYSSKPSPWGRGGTYVETNTILGNQYK